MFNPMQLIGQLKNSGNPMALLQQMAGNDPNMQRALQMAQQGDPQEIVANLMKERGLTMDQVKQMAGQFGIQL